MADGNSCLPEEIFNMLVNNRSGHSFFTCSSNRQIFRSLVIQLTNTFLAHINSPLIAANQSQTQTSIAFFVFLYFSQDNIETEYKFARAQLWADYIGDGVATLPPPLNLIPSPKSIVRWACKLTNRCFGVPKRLPCCTNVSVNFISFID